jgi:hypothetical protein
MNRGRWGGRAVESGPFLGLLVEGESSVDGWMEPGFGSGVKFAAFGYSRGFAAMESLSVVVIAGSLALAEPRIG